MSSTPFPIVVFTYIYIYPLNFLHKLKKQKSEIVKVEFDITRIQFRHIKGRDNLIPDVLSRVPIQ